MAAGVALFMGEGRMCQRLLIKAALLMSHSSFSRKALTRSDQEFSCSSTLLIEITFHRQSGIGPTETKRIV